jgi:vesicle-fusing ATPase
MPFFCLTRTLWLNLGRVAVSTADFSPVSDGSDLLLLVNDLYVFSARPLDSFPPGRISMSDPQRTWAGVALTDSVKAQIYDPFSQGGQAYLAAADIEVGFAGKKRTETPYDQDELAAVVIKVRLVSVKLSPEYTDR